MADRKTSETISLRVDLAAGLNLSVTLTDGLGVTRGTGTLTEIGNSGRYTGSVTPSGNVCEGEWTATYSDGTVQTFTVGTPGFTDKGTLRSLLASRIDDVEYGTVVFANGVDVIDDSLVGIDGDFVKMWMLLNLPNEQAGLYKRITAYNGSTLTLSSSWGSDPATGDTFLLTKLHPRELDNALRVAYTTLGYLGRIRVRAEALTPDDNGRVTVPAGWTHVFDVWSKLAGDDTVSPTQVALTDWAPTTGRTITIQSATADNEIILYGLRDARFPLWDDSTSDLDPEMVLALASAHLNIARASGSTLDPEDHMHRQIASFQELETVMRRRAGRAVNNQREVLP